MFRHADTSRHEHCLFADVLLSTQPVSGGLNAIAADDVPAAFQTPKEAHTLHVDAEPSPPTIYWRATYFRERYQPLLPPALLFFIRCRRAMLRC